MKCWIMHGLVTCCMVAFMAAAQPTQGQAYPNRPIRLVVPTAPGGSSDFIARYLAQKLSEALGQQVIVDNRQGAASMIGTDLAAKAAPDGYTIVVVDQTYAINAAARKLTYDPRDLTAISMLAKGRLVLAVHPSMPVRTVKELVALARSRPGQLSCGTAGSGGIGHLACEALKIGAKAEIVHVPYKGTGPVVADLVAGQINLGFLTAQTAIPQVKAGRLRALGVTGESRIAALPDVPAMNETDPVLAGIFPWWAALAPAGTPKDIIARLNAEIVKILKRPDVINTLSEHGVEAWPTTSEVANAFIKSEIEKYARIVKVAGLKLE